VTGTPLVKKSNVDYANPYTIPIVAQSNVPPGCSADKTYTVGQTDLQAQPALANMQTAAVRFAAVRGPNNSTSGSIGLLRVVAGMVVPTGVQYQLSECPGDFTANTLTPTVRCGGYFVVSSATVKTNATSSISLACQLDPTKTYYLNLRYVDPVSGLSTCDNGSGRNCTINVNFYWQ